MEFENYCLPENYNHRLNNSFFDDTPYKDEYQDCVYSKAKEIVIKNKYKSIGDIGTGSGYKLIKYFDNYDTIGIDLEPTLSWLKNNYPFKKWSTMDDLKETNMDIIICSDVIEHIPDLNSFMLELVSLNFNKIIISTPDKQAMYGHNHIGPPANLSHVREWNQLELNKYISKFLNIEEQVAFINTQIVVCSKKI